MSAIGEIRRRWAQVEVSGDRYTHTAVYLGDVSVLLDEIDVLGRNLDEMRRHVELLVEGLRQTVDLLERASLAAESAQVRRMMLMAGIETGEEA